MVRKSRIVYLYWSICFVLFILQSQYTFILYSKKGSDCTRWHLADTILYWIYRRPYKNLYIVDVLLSKHDYGDDHFIHFTTLTLFYWLCRFSIKRNGLLNFMGPPYLYIYIKKCTLKKMNDKRTFPICLSLLSKIY